MLLKRRLKDFKKHKARRTWGGIMDVNSKLNGEGPKGS